MVQLYIKYIDNNYYLLDLDPKEDINYKVTSKDLNDISKIFSPFTQSFNIQATDKNKRLLGFIGNEKIQRLNNSGVFDSMIYISGFLFQSGKLSFAETDYKNKEQKNFKVNFASNLTGIAEKLGSSTIQELFQDSNGAFDPGLIIDWNVNTLKESMRSVTWKTLSNGLDFRYGIPFISNKRVWTYNQSSLSTVDNIAFNQSRTPATVNQIELDEVRPCINYMSIMKHLLIKIGVPVICPMFTRNELSDLYVWCNSEKLIVPNASSYLLNDFRLFNSLISELQPLPPLFPDPPPAIPRWTISLNLTNGVYKAKRNAVTKPNYWGNGFYFTLVFNNLIALEPIGTKIKVSMVNNDTGIVINSQEITGNTYSFTILDLLSGVTMLNPNGELNFRFEVLPLTLVSWSTITVTSFVDYIFAQNNFIICKYLTIGTEFSDSAILGGNKLNLISALPKMKCTDFLKSFFKTFNISVISTGLNDQSMYWLTPGDIKETNKPYSKRIVDYTSFADVTNLNKKKGNEYNQYSFSHLKSKYYDAIYGDGTEFGSLVYPLLPPSKPTKFEVKTDYSIIKQSNTFTHPSTARTCLGFKKETPTVLPNGGNRYKPVYDEFTIFYLESKSTFNTPLSVELNDFQNAQLTGILEASFKNSSTGKTLGFGADNLDTDSLYLNYYKEFIELLLNPNAYKSEFELNLPPNEIFLNFSNTKQGESNIPTGFRPQNEIIIGEQRYTLLDIVINLDDGKAKLTVLNF